jgi:adenylosuccinate synthase
MTNYIVTDLSYGDSGKGTTVDYLARQGHSLVVRHNGGPQAGHNVVTSDGLHHTFSQFGSGTFAGASTFLSENMLINPLNMMREYDHLMELGHGDVWARTYIDQNCRIITPWHVAINRLQELARGDHRHGSVGEGVGVAVHQDLSMGPCLYVNELLKTNESLLDQLRLIRANLIDVYGDLIDDSPTGQIMTDRDVFDLLLRRYNSWKSGVRIVGPTALATLMDQHEHTIFEGAQGVLLDESYGFHPYTTWSTCTHENAVKLLAGQDAVRLGVIRTVTTRHGPGPHPTEDGSLAKIWKEPHNGAEGWQGAFRVGHLDLVAHKYAIRACDGVDQIVVTHADHRWNKRKDRWWYSSKYDGWRDGIPLPNKGDLVAQELTTEALFGTDAILTECNTEELMRAIEANLGPIALVSHGPTAEDKRCLIPCT